jgi:hypothetical protein
MSTAPQLEPRDGRLPVPATPAGTAGGPRRGRARRTLELVLEMLLALLLTLGCFLALLVVLDLVFPAATGLRDLLLNPGAGASRPRGSRTASNEDGWQSAALSVLDNEVLRKASGSVAWSPVRSGLDVHPGDGVQTTRQGMATVTFDQDDWLRVGRNSLVILRQSDDTESDPRAPSLTVVSGEVWGQFGGRRGGSVRLPGVAGRAPVRLASDPGSRGPTRFKVTVRRDHSLAIQVFAGRTTLTTAQGTLRLGASQYVVLRPSGPVAVVRQLPAAPLVSTPADGGTWRFREFPPAVTFRWDGGSRADRHRLVIARDPAFRDVVFDETVAGDSLTLGSLPPGEYSWHVSAVDAGLDGAPSAARRLSLVLDDVPPELQVAFPDGPVAAGLCRVEGATEPGSRLFVAGAPVLTDADGRFRCDTPLGPGTNLVVVEAVDAAGNSTYRSQIVRRVNQH